MTARRTILASAFALASLAVSLPAWADRDDWRGHGRWERDRYYDHRGWRPPPVYYAPPPVVYAPRPYYYAAPPPVAYAPPPPVYYAPPPPPVYAAPGLSFGLTVPLR